MNPWLLPLIFLAAVSLGGLFYDLVHRGRRERREAASVERVGVKPDHNAPPPDPPAQQAPSGNGHRPRNRDKKKKRK